MSPPTSPSPRGLSARAPRRGVAGAIALASLISLLGATASASAQNVPFLPCCIDFDGTTQGGISGQNVKDLEVRFPGPSGDPADGYLHAMDASGGSRAFLSDPMDGTPNCFGEWKALLGPGRCLELCWDVNLLTDGDNSQIIAKPAKITIWSGALRATFLTFANITEIDGPNNGWYSFCAPIALADSAGNLPSNDQGEWLMNDASGNPAPPEDWNTLLCNVDKISFFVDYHDTISEEWGWDNVCLQEGECPDCMDVFPGTWDCTTGPGGERIFNYTFDVTNNSPNTATVALIPEPDGFNIDPNTFDLVPDLAPGDTGTVTLSFDGVDPGSEICFDFILFNPAVGECCREEICLQVPCVKISSETVACSTIAGATDYQFTLTNISGGPLDSAYLLSNDPGVTITPAVISLFGLADGVSQPVGPVTIAGAAPNEDYCFSLVVLDANQSQCCIQEVCIAIPDCGIGTIPGPGPNGVQVAACEPDDGTAVSQVIDFENIPGLGIPTELTPVTIIDNQYESTHGVTFSLTPPLPAVGPRIGEVGSGTPQNGHTAFTGPTGPDTVAAGVDVGRFFLTDDGTPGGDPKVVRVGYAVPTFQVCGDFIDLDGSEEWEVVAVPGVGEPVEVKVIVAPSGPGNPGDGRLTHWEFSRAADEGPISLIEFRSEAGSFGFALDNFCPRGLVDCALICNSEVLCDPANPGDYLWKFTVQNTSGSVMDHLVLPGSDVSPGFVSFPDPLEPGEAAQIFLTLSNRAPGPATVPMILVSTADGECCRVEHFLELPECDCTQVLSQSFDFEGVDPVSGLLCYTYTATLENLTGEVLEHLFFLPPNGNPQGISFDPSSLPLDSIAPGATTTVGTTVKIPAGVNEIDFTISVHNENFVECCAIGRLLHVTDACDCEETVVFESGTPLPEEVFIINLAQHPVTGKVGFPANGMITPFPFVYMATDRDTVVRISTDTGAVLGEYRTAPETHPGPDPSRTTVDKFGECWVGNRVAYVNIRGEPGTVVRIGLILGGTRGDRSGPVGGPYTFTPNPAGEYLQGPFSYVSPSVLDRDGDGLIRTSSGLPQILDWDPALTGGNNNGGVSLADDECIVNFVEVPEAGPRALAIDSNNDLWVSGFSTSKYQQVFGTTGTLGDTHNVAGGYGALIDGNDVLWSVSKRGSTVWRHDLGDNTITNVRIPVPGAYGIGIDPCDGNIWVSSRFSVSPLLTEINPAGVIVGTDPQQGSAQGLCVDQNGDVWISGGGGGVWKHDPSGVYQDTISAPIFQSSGVAVDHNGRIWVSDKGGDAARRIDPNHPSGVPSVDLTVPLGSGARPYNYSDMTGFVTLGASGQTGIVVFTHDSLCPGTDWGRVSWLATGLSADGCALTTEVRASDDPLNYPATWTPVGNNISFCGGTGLPSVTGQYIQVRIILTRPSGCPPECDPQLCWLKAECCDAFGVGPGNAPPVVDATSDVMLMPVGGTGPATGEISAWVFDPEGGELEIAWTVDGTTALITHVQGEDIVELNRLFPNGISEVVLSVSDGQNVTTATTMVMVGDHEAPVVNCTQGDFVLGDKRVQAFEAAIPDIVATTIATDNVTPSGSLILNQSPAPGQLVGQGTHPITVTAEDAAGNVGQCTVYLIVEPAVNFTTISNYDIFVAGTAIPIDLGYDVDPSVIVGMTIYVNGVVEYVGSGPLAQPLQLHLPEGSYEIHVVITNAAGQMSQSRDLQFGVISNPVPPPSQIAPVEIEWEADLIEALLLHFQAPDARQCCIQTSLTLEPDSWETIHVIEGSGQQVEYRYPVSPSDEPKLFFRLLYIP